MKNVIKWICWFFAFGCSISVQAAIVQGNDPNQAAGDDGFNLTIDTNTGLRWLDLTLTNGRSFNDVSSNFAVGGDYEDYRHATRNEILSFWSNAGINYTANYIHQPDNSMAISSLMEKLGLTLDLTYDGGLGIYKGAGGWFDDTAYRPGATSPSRVFLQYRVEGPSGQPFCPDNPECIDAFLFQETVFSFDTTQFVTGNMLVGTAVPVPAAFWLFGSAVLGLIGVTRRKAPS